MSNKFFHKTKSWFAKAKETIRTAKEKDGNEATKKEEKALSARLPRKEKRELVDISVSSVTKSTLAIIGLVALAYGIYLTQNILLTFFISIFLAAALDPFVSKMESKKIPRWLGIFIIYVIIIAIIGLLISLIIPILITQIPRIAEVVIRTLVNLFPGINVNSAFIQETASTIQSYLSQINVQEISGANVQSILNSASTIVNETWRNALSIVGTVSGGIINFTIIMVITFFLLIDKNSLSSFFTSLFPTNYKEYIALKAQAIQRKIGEWLTGQLLLSLSIFITTLIVLTILKVDFAFTLAIIAGITEFIPYIGPLIAGIPAVLVAVGQGGFVYGLWILVAVVAIQQIENNFLVPIIMKKSVGLSPVATMFAMMIGFQILGILGMILAVPIATSIGIFITDYSQRGKK
jgi:predicted PurR-regulated permease PerM